ncbi:hypothetical protein D3C80_1734590 [compost metagenome]
MQGGQPGGLRCMRQPAAAFEPGGAIAGTDTQGQVGLVTQFIVQGRQAGLELISRADASQLRTKQRQARVQQLLVEFDEVLLAGPAEQQTGAQRDGGGAGGEQQGQAAAEGNPAHHSVRSSST